RRRPPTATAAAPARRGRSAGRGFPATASCTPLGFLLAGAGDLVAQLGPDAEDERAIGRIALAFCARHYCAGAFRFRRKLHKLRLTASTNMLAAASLVIPPTDRI